MANEYVPSGLTREQYEKIKQEDAAAKTKQLKNFNDARAREAKGEGPKGRTNLNKINNFKWW
jgi:hypothetical protein